MSLGSTGKCFLHQDRKARQGALSYPHWIRVIRGTNQGWEFFSADGADERG